MGVTPTSRIALCSIYPCNLMLPLGFPRISILRVAYLVHLRGMRTTIRSFEIVRDASIENGGSSPSSPRAFPCGHYQKIDATMYLRPILGYEFYGQRRHSGFCWEQAIHQHWLSILLLTKNELARISTVYELWRASKSRRRKSERRR